ncbi:nucleotidyltransferase family protein [Granulicella aggregans]|jgi:CTP:molybdopterin cytidylyltransferase MocA|uniref:nucleotidyltransferase family protein n=1 Tax=Granulicella aggregans TaxID=474949 RepID=UPI0021E0666C|nr:nucleotidyltransferase family protein [Granulicella aggregans]
MKVAAIVLAAGASRRLGQPKQNILLGGETLLERTVRVAKLAGLDPVYVVVAPGQELSSLPFATMLFNPNAPEGMAASIRTGVLAAGGDGAEGAVILACDQPAVTPEHLSSIVGDRTAIVASSYAGRKGVPAYFPAATFEQLLELRGDIGARQLISNVSAMELANGDLDIDTEEDLARAQTIYSTAKR